MSPGAMVKMYMLQRVRAMFLDDGSAAVLPELTCPFMDITGLNFRVLFFFVFQVFFLGCWLQ
jgi:hypothetical protein